MYAYKIRHKQCLFFVVVFFFLLQMATDNEPGSKPVINRFGLRIVAINENLQWKMLFVTVLDPRLSTASTFPTVSYLA